MQGAEQEGRVLVVATAGQAFSPGHLAAPHPERRWRWEGWSRVTNLLAGFGKGTGYKGQY